MQKKTFGKRTAFISRQKFRLGRGQGYISIINTMLLLGIAFHLTNPIYAIAVGLGTLFCVWLIGFIDDRFRLVHAESDQNIYSTTPYFQRLQENVEEIKEILKEEKYANSNRN